MRSRPRLLFVVAAALAGTAACSSLDDAAPVAAPPAPRDVLVRVGEDAELEPARIDAYGNVLIDGDIVIAHEHELRAEPAGAGGLATYSVVIPVGDKRWPNAKVLYSFDAAFVAGDPEDDKVVKGVKRAMAHLRELTPVRFSETTSTTAAQIHFVKVTSYDATFSGVGRLGGVQNVGVRADTSEETAFQWGLHAIVHSLGFYHEHQRPDRDTYVDVAAGCAAASRQEAYSLLSHDSVLSAQPYDYDSIMQYDSTAFCNRNPTTNLCNCLPVQARFSSPRFCENCTNSDSDAFKEQINADWSRLSLLDVNALWLTYGKALGKSGPHDEFGRAFATGDFDGDGFTDLAVGVPTHQQAVGAPGAGSVFVLKGTSAGLVPWQNLHQEMRVDSASGPVVGSQLGENEPGDMFGFALAAGDVDHDGVDDLAIGAPEDHSKRGAVYLFLGSSRKDAIFGVGLRPWKKLTPASVNAEDDVPGDRFGHAVVIAELDTEWDGKEIAVGAPWKQPFGLPHSGMVVIAHKVGNDLKLVQSLIPADGGNFDAFGFALAAGDVTNDVEADLFVGAPEHAIGEHHNAGKVYFYAASSAAKQQVFRRSYTADDGIIGFLQDDQQFGFSLAVGDLNDDGHDDVAIGIPGNQEWSGAVRLLYASADAADPTIGQLIDQSGIGSNEAGDQFGRAVAIVPIRGAFGRSLVVGVPREIPGGATGVRRGYAYVFNGDRVGSNGYSQGLSPDLSNIPEVEGTRFGTAIAGADFDGDGRGELVIGMPGMKDGTVVEAGAIKLYEVSDDKVKLANRGVFWQDLPAPDLGE